MQIRNSTGYFYSPAILFNSMYWHVFSSHLILLVKTHIIVNSLHEVCKQTTFKNFKWDNGCRENRATITWFHLSGLWSRYFHANFVIKWIGHFRITLGLFFKASPGAHPFIWKLVLIHMQMKTNFHMKRWAPGLALKKRPKVIRKWPINKGQIATGTRSRSWRHKR